MLKSVSPKPALFIAVHCLAWWIMILSAKSGLDGYGDMAEVYAWSQHWLAGSDKHPQFLPWVAKLWFLVAPKSVASFYFLSALNLAAALFGILALGRALKLDAMRLAVALALAALALPYLTLPGKLNMNTICLSTWPWTAWAFVKATETHSRRQLPYAALFGLLAGVSMLGKYYSIVLLIPLFAYTFTPGQRPIWRTGAPWIAIAVFLIVSAPHILWLSNHADAIAYAREQGEDVEMAQNVRYILKFLAAPLIFWPLPLTLAVLFLARGPFFARIASLLRWPKAPGMLGVAAIGPWLTTILFSVFGIVQLSMPWAIPIGFAFTLYLAANAHPDALASNGPRLLGLFRFIWPVMILAGIGMGTVAGLRGDVRFYMPGEEGAKAVVEYWRNRHDAPLRWVAKGNDAALLAFHAPEPVEALPDLPDRLPSYYPPVEDWQNAAGAIFCSLERSGTVDDACLSDAAAWAEAANLRSQAVTLAVKRGGLRFPRDVPFDLAVVYVWPR